MTHRQSAACSGNALSAAEASFRLLTTGPHPLAVDGRLIGRGLPARLVDLAELRRLLLAPAATDTLKDAAWAELVRRAHTGDPAWVVGCVGVAMPGLKNIAARVIRTSPAFLADDIVSELLTEFVAQLRRVDVQSQRIATRLLWWARKAALRVRDRESRQAQPYPADLAMTCVGSAVDPIEVLAEAVRAKVITPAAAALINATRLEGVTLRAYAAARSVPEDRLRKMRKAAETRLAQAIRDGQVSANITGCLSGSHLPPGAS
ncbi:hypothetical protein [Thermoactinospora rubra]|uniref:hypothetical protein n=1 Tax=Thermoactinospora rubra TaxID=1088767 RepID=UPI000A0F5F97|nr:hypothetical protein [Thermoactinospora rubra]